MKNIANHRLLNFSIKHYNNAPWSNEKNVKFYASGREAIISLIESFPESKQKTALLPAYVPEGLYAPFIKKNWEVILYPIDKQLNPKWDNLESLIKKHTPSIAVFIHYFGIKLPIEKFVQLCHQYTINVIEDHAHLLPTKNKNMYTGDYILYSLPKMLGIPDGAPLISRHPPVNAEPLQCHSVKTNRLYITKQTIMLLVTTLVLKIPSLMLVKITTSVLAKLLNSYADLMKIFHKPNKISKLSKAIINHTNFDELIQKRSQYVAMYDQQLDPNVFTKFIQNTSQKAATFGYPVLVNNRNDFIKFLSTKGIFGTMLIRKWDYTAKALSTTSFEDTCYIINHHFIFPTAAHLTKQEIQYIIECANQWVNKYYDK